VNCPPRLLYFYELLIIRFSKLILGEIMNSYAFTIGLMDKINREANYILLGFFIFIRL